MDEGLLAVTKGVAQEEWVKHMAKKALVLTFFISAPALSWYAAVPLTSMTGAYLGFRYFSSSTDDFRGAHADITAIYNVFAFVGPPHPAFHFVPSQLADTR